MRRRRRKGGREGWGWGFDEAAGWDVLRGLVGSADVLESLRNMIEDEEEEGGRGGGGEEGGEGGGREEGVGEGRIF